MNENEMLAEMKAAAGYLRNARIDLETGATKATAIPTIDGGLRRLEAAFSKVDAARDFLSNRARQKGAE